MSDGEHDAKESPDVEPAGDEFTELPESLIPRWLAAVVLLLLVASGLATVWMVLGA